MNTPPKDVEERLGAVLNELTETVIELVEENEPELIFQAVRYEIAKTFSFELATHTDKRVREEREKQNGEWVLQLEDWIERLENLKKYLKDNE